MKTNISIKAIELVKELKREQAERERREFFKKIIFFSGIVLIGLAIFGTISITTPKKFSIDINMDNNTLQAVQSLNETIQSIATAQFKEEQGLKQCLKDCKNLFQRIGCKDCTGIKPQDMDWFNYPASCEEYCNNQTR